MYLSCVGEGSASDVSDGRELQAHIGDLWEYIHLWEYIYGGDHLQMYYNITWYRWSFYIILQMIYKINKIPTNGDPRHSRLW